MPNDGYRALIEDAPTQPSAVSAPSGTKSHCSRLCEIAIRIPHSRAHRRRSFRKDDVRYSIRTATLRSRRRRGACPELSFDLGSSPSCTPKGFLSSSIRALNTRKKRSKECYCSATDLMLPCAISTDATSTFESGLECSGSAPNTPAGCLNVTTSSGPMCRICHEGDQTESLMSLCRCSGTMGLLHVSCLETLAQCAKRGPLRALPPPLSHGCATHLLASVLPFGVARPLAADSSGRRVVLRDPDAVGRAQLLPVRQSAFKYAHEGRVMEAASLVTLAGLWLQATVWAFRTARFHYRAFAVWEAVNPMRRILAPPFSSGEGGHDRATAGQPTGLREMVDVVAGNAETERTTQRRGGGGQRLPLELPPNTLPEGSLPALQQPVYALGPMANFEYW
ncbi:hypothetical protein HPB52_025193 [Rhipicephalus sanguineus]|uniref:RING-CH-type domain-containing protein n=1 Tax=Rhipicephalus sanguineus TaxID=34632 RepID=A0A9D4TDD7_RHISA|nr:hypothetical protein HPB52_025193 [Rhipicephalus sanguineus]